MGGSLFVTNCTAALELAYRYAGVGPGDEVIVPTNTFIATVAYPGVSPQRVRIEFA